MKIGRKILAASACIAAFFLITGCASKNKTKTDSPAMATIHEKTKNSSELVTAEEVIRAFREEGYDNYKQTITCSNELTIGHGDDAVVLPSKMKIKVFRAGSNLYETQNMKVKHTDLQIEYDDESYIEMDGADYTMYSSLNDQEAWYVKKTQDAKEARIISLDPDDFKNASCVLSEKTHTFIVTEPLVDLLDSQDLFLESLESKFLEKTEGAETALKEALLSENASAVFTFSADTLRLLSVKYDPVEYQYNIIDDKPETCVTCKGKMKINFDDYGWVKEAKVRIPDEVRENASMVDEAAGV